LFRHSLKLALEHELPTPALRVYNNLGDVLCRRDRYEDALPYYTSGIALARKVGNRLFESTLLSESSFPLMHTGRWDDALAAMAEIPESHFAALATPTIVPAEIEVARGRSAEARQYLALLSHLEGSADVQQRTLFAEGQALVLRAEGRYEEALAAAEEVVDAIGILGAGYQSVKAGLVHALEINSALDRVDNVEELLRRIESLRPGELSPFLRAQAARFRGRLGSEEAFKNAAGILREFGLVFWLAVTQLEHGEWLVARGRAEEAEPLLAEAQQTFERLEARPWLERAAQVSPLLPAPAAVTAGS
jgi:tetratricopeptide (TPR) repeat protein